MDTLQFLKAILPPNGNYFIYLPKFHDRERVHHHFTNIAAMADAIEQYDANGITTYHACASYKEPWIDIDGKKKRRVNENVAAVKAFWCDIDCGTDKAEAGKGYATKAEAAAALNEFLVTTRFPVPLIVDSGFGLHAYWTLTEEIDPLRWRRLAAILKAAFIHFGLRVDPTRTADAASILRPVGAHNRKSDPARLVKAKNAVTAYTPDEMEARIVQLQTDNALIPPRVYNYDINDDLTAHRYPNIPSSAKEIAKHCNQVRLMADTLGDVGYEHWRGVIGIIKICEEGLPLALEWSSQRQATGHSQTDTENKYESWNAGPTTCSFFEQNNPSGCEGCPHRGKIKSPIVLGRLAPPSEEQVIEVVNEETKTTEQHLVPALPETFSWSMPFMVRAMVIDGVTEILPFSPCLFYAVTQIRKTDGRYAIRWHAVMPNGALRVFDIDSGRISHGGNDMLKAFGEYGVIKSEHAKSSIHMEAYVRNWITRLQNQSIETESMTSFGWKGGMLAFLLGSTMYHADGRTTEVLMSHYADDQGRKIFDGIHGTAAGWSQGINFLYNRPGMEPMQYAIASAFGSLLVPLGGELYKGIPLALSGSRSGKGKTTVCQAALYAFGNAQAMTIASERGSTKNARWALFGTMGSLPVLMDEVSNANPQDISDLAYQLSLGQEPRRLTARGDGVRFANQATWALHSFMTSNKLLGASLATLRDNTEAEAVRFLEIPIDLYDIPMLDPTEVAQAFETIAANRGSAGEVFIRHVVTNFPEVQKRWSSVNQKVLQLIPDLAQSQYRFFRAHIVSTLTAAELMGTLRLTDFDVTALAGWVMDWMDYAIKTVVEMNTASEENALSRMISDLGPYTIVTFDFKSFGVEQVRQLNNPVRARFITGGSGKMDSPDEAGRFYVDRAEMRRWCLENRVDFKGLVNYASKQGALVHERKRITLVRGTQLPGGMLDCVVLDLNKLAAVQKPQFSVVPNEAIANSIGNSRTSSPNT